MKHKRKIKFRYLIITAAALIIIFSLYFSGFIINTTSSMPLGLYYTSGDTSDLKRGETVIVDLPYKVQYFGVQRNYVKNMETKLVKEIIAVPGDNVILTDDTISVNGKKYPAVSHKYDGNHRKLNLYPRGKYNNTAGYWVYGSNDKDESWDSRYFGPLKKSQIIKRAYSIFTF